MTPPPGDAYIIPEYLCYSSKNLTEWKYEGVVLKMSDVSWADNNSAWTGQVAKYNDKYYFYYCSWNSKDAGKQSIGVAVSDSATGPFVDIGEALVKGSFTTDHTSDWNDIDPTVWIETDKKGVEHRYLGWGNSKLYVCELNEDMISLKDRNGDGQITFGSRGDLVSQTPPSSFTEGPWFYRRRDENGECYGPYYCFYAHGWREKLGYATCEDLWEGMWFDSYVLTQPSATSNTSHYAVFDFNGKTYMIYHNGSLSKGSGLAGITEEDSRWEIVPGSADPENACYVSIESYNKAGLYLTELKGTVVLSQDYSGTLGQFQTFQTVEGLAGSGVSFESVSTPGMYLTLKDGKATLTDGADLNACSFHIATVE